MARRRPTFTRERAALLRGLAPVAGVDEVGRGPLAGPVVVAAVILDPKRIPRGLADSKLVAPEARERLFGAIVASAQVGISVVDVATIDRLNILEATMLAMRDAVSRLPQRPALVLVDGNRLPGLDCPAEAIVGGDALCKSIAAASIVAKVTRDRIMVELAQSCPGYGFERHKGYGTAEHLAALDRFGVTAHHRCSFAPVRERLGCAAPLARPHDAAATAPGAGITPGEAG